MRRMKGLSGVFAAIVEGLFVVGDGDCAEASDSVRCWAQPERYPPSSIMNRTSLAALIGNPNVPPRKGARGRGACPLLLGLRLDMIEDQVAILVFGATRTDVIIFLMYRFYIFYKAQKFDQPNRPLGKVEILLGEEFREHQTHPCIEL